MEIEVVADVELMPAKPFVPWRLPFRRSPYEVPHAKTDTYGYYTNNVYTEPCALRSPGDICKRVSNG